MFSLVKYRERENNLVKKTKEEVSKTDQPWENVYEDEKTNEETKRKEETERNTNETKSRSNDVSVL